MNFLNLIECPFCLENIQKGAFVCKHCGRELEPEFLHLYRKVLEEKPELRKNTEKSKRELEVQIRHAYLNEIMQMKLEAEKQKEIEKERLKNEEEELKKYLQKKKIQREKIDDFIYGKIFKFLILPVIVLSLVGSLIFFNSNYWKEYRFIASGGKNVVYDSFLKKHFSNLDYFELKTNNQFKLAEKDSEQLCKVKLKRFEVESNCDFIEYIDTSNDESIFVVFRIMLCLPDNTKVRSVYVQSIWEDSGEIPKDGGMYLIQSTSKYLETVKRLNFGC